MPKSELPSTAVPRCDACDVGGGRGHVELIEQRHPPYRGLFFVVVFRVVMGA